MTTLVQWGPPIGWEWVQTTGATTTAYGPFGADSTNASTYDWSFGRQIINDRDARIAQRAVSLPPVRAFNRYINASDLLEEFIGYLGGMGMRKLEVLNAPLDLFIKWLIIRACAEDGEEAPPEVTLQLPKPTQSRCLGCQKFMTTALVPFHGERCAGFYYRRLEVAA